MIALIQRVKNASVEINNKVYSQISKGLIIFLGISHNDSEQDIEWLTNKIVNLRIFDDENNVMNLSCIDIDGEIITISQFTLHARTKKGNRPSYIDAAKPEVAEPLYLKFVKKLDSLCNKKTLTGIFGANMQVSLCNDGPVTIIIDSKNRR
ncbi:MAG: D-aminoacyl-tRNA deacylase [Bacteroidales bacterium]|nr:D-aminoacyl-tRNA deacylase [Bacteroidales bacterium]MDD4217374.1 D-aminoacyl-tRNA deacylase [Bacteroidales bacterium]MDY0141275.1 D-aminoacyl-tRNA deacylase [Bacteroidales bacterium]